VEQPVGEGGDGLEPLLVDAPPDAPPERRKRVLAEVLAVLPVNRLEEQPELDVLELEPRAGGMRLSP
jgi:hypothetical protein